MLWAPELSSRVCPREFIPHWQAAQSADQWKPHLHDPATLCDFVTGLHEPLNWRRCPSPKTRASSSTLPREGEKRYVNTTTLRSSDPWRTVGYAVRR